MTPVTVDAHDQTFNHGEFRRPKNCYPARKMDVHASSNGQCDERANSLSPDYTHSREAESWMLDLLMAAARDCLSPELGKEG